MKHKATFLFLLVGTHLVDAQMFVNLDFEAANLPTIPQGQFGSQVAVSDATPGWLVFWGTTRASFVRHNDFALGSPNVSIFGPDWTSAQGIIEGQYTVLLQAGVGNVDASISQSGLIPFGSQSLQFKLSRASDVSSIADFAVSFAGERLDIVELSSEGGYTLFGADISGSSGQTGDLKFTSMVNSSHPNNFLLDSISFSVTPVPEPNTWALLGLGGLLAGLARRQASRRK